jgi:multidrug efflux system membrane fusion protein
MSSLEQIKANKNYRSAAIILAILLLWMLSGVFSADDSDNAANATREPRSTELYNVRAETITAQAYSPKLRISARTEANRTVNVKAEVDGQVIKIPAKKGSMVKTGDVICELAVEDRQLRVVQTNAEVSKATLEYDAALRLKSSGFQARTVIAAKKSELESAKASLARNKIDLEKIKIRAPFDGVVDERPVEIGDLIERGDICATVLDFNPLIVAGQVAGANINQIHEDDNITAFLLTGEHVQGKVRFIGSSANNITRTFRIEAEVTNPQNLLRSGLTADILLATPPVKAHLISPALLSLDDTGEIGVRTLDNNQQVNFVNVTLIGDDPEGVWVAGLAETTTIITVGQEYVSRGQTVNAVMEPNNNTVVHSPAELAKPTPNSIESDAIESNPIGTIPIENNTDFTEATN